MFTLFACSSTSSGCDNAENSIAIKREMITSYENYIGSMEFELEIGELPMEKFLEERDAAQRQIGAYLKEIEDLNQMCG